MTGESAPAKLGQEWRNARYEAIKARIRNEGLSEWFEAYMQPRFGSPSLSELSNENLDSVYRAVMGKR